MTRHFNITALFAGVGGIELGFHRHGHRTTLLCEADAEASAILAAGFPHVPIKFDVRDTPALMSEIDHRSNLLTAGFPCTDLSQAGRTQGFGGGQSSLIRKVFDLMDARPFPHVLIETGVVHALGVSKGQTN
jgi:DNA (cytosine-5)-methyltransferase 1